MSLEPITRQEQIIAGKELEPITRMEKFLKEYVGGSGGGYTDQVPVSTDADGSVFNGTGYQNDSYISSGTGGVSSQAGYVVTGFIPYAEGDVIRFKGAIWGEGSYSRIAFYDADKNKILVGTYPSSGEVADEGNGVYRLTPSVAEGGGKAFVRLSFYGTGENLVVTINEKIVSAVADWNTMLNKPFYEEDDGTIHHLDHKYIKDMYYEERRLMDIVPETTLEFSGAGDNTRGFINATALVEGDTYTIVWDGVPYTCIGAFVNFDGINMVGVGNWAAIGGENTGEPFAIACIPANDWYVPIPMTDGTSHTFKISGEVDVVTTIPVKYAPVAPIFNLADLGIDELAYDTEVTVKCKSDQLRPIHDALDRGVVFLDCKLASKMLSRPEGGMTDCGGTHRFALVGGERLNDDGSKIIRERDILAISDSNVRTKPLCLEISILNVQVFVRWYALDFSSIKVT